MALIPLAAGPLGCGHCDLDITTASLPDATVGAPYNVTLGSDCGGDDWFLASGLLPPGISLIQDGVLRGTPTVRGTYFFTIGVVDYENGYVDDTAYRGLALTVNDSPPQPTQTPVP